MSDLAAHQPEDRNALIAALWERDQSAALRLFNIDAAQSPALTQTLSHSFADLLRDGFPQRPETAQKRLCAVQQTLHLALKAYFSLEPPPDIGERIAILLYPFRFCADAGMASALCDVLRHYPLWDGIPEKPQLWKIKRALTEAIVAFAPDALDLFWERFDRSDAPDRAGMEFGLELLEAAHACEQIAAGLERSAVHSVRQKIVESLEKVGVEANIPPLIRAYRRAAHDDWELARHIERACRAILYRERAEAGHNLLRASEQPASELLHEIDIPYYDVANLLQTPETAPESETCDANHSTGDTEL
jgi:hypothetical protein